MLSKSGASLYNGNHEQYNTFFEAISCKNYAVVEKMLNLGINVKQLSVSGKSGCELVRAVIILNII